MQKIPAFNQNNQPLEIEIIRYFKVNDKKYLIFTLEEKDEQGYIKVYVSKILGLNGTLAAYDIIDETEWANVKDLVKRIIKINREGGSLEVEDLSLERLNNIKINGQQVFKLISNLIELLGSNIDAKKDEEEMIPHAPKEEQISNEATSLVGTVSPELEKKEEKSEEVELPNTSTSSEYQRLYKELFDRYQLLLEENSKLKTKLDSLKAIINGE
ncbi:MAG: DUF1292 domain-containing protein [Bacilli bacterium]|nr:DUF1292 domain-containing protein [Bacilli bacterium]